MVNSFDGKVALITGAARGIGAGVAREFAARGGKVALLGLEPEELQKLAAEIGDAAAWWESDVRDNTAVHLAVDAAAAHFGRIDFVLANAGIASYGTVRQIDNDSFERVVDINVNGVYRTLHATIPHLEKTRGYALVVASLASFTPLAGLASYNASKAGAESLALATKQEVAHLGIGVGVCHPSWIDTDIVRNAEKDLPSFKATRAKLPWPANDTTTVEECVDLILRGFTKRKSRVYVPKGVLAANWTKAFTNSPLVWPVLRRMATKAVPQMEKEVAALGRSHHAHTPITGKKL
ncbi:MAG: SDR family oxidoreductase [Aeromicrobium sp.]